jgi:hypothetical protein
MQPERCCDRIYYTIFERSCIGISSAIDPYIQQSDFEKAEPITRAIYSIHVIRLGQICTGIRFFGARKNKFLEMGKFFSMTPKTYNQDP